jgi:hypothetical protein
MHRQSRFIVFSLAFAEGEQSKEFYLFIYFIGFRCFDEQERLCVSDVWNFKGRRSEHLGVDV